MKHPIALLLLFFLLSCNSKENAYDASGTFEADEVIVPAETNGIIRELSISEGDEVKAGQVVGYIDSTQLFLRKKQLLAQSKAVLSRAPDINAQLAALEEQLKQAQREQQRVTSLLKSDAATTKQMDDVNAQVSILEKQIAATRSSLGITSSGINEESLPIAVQVEQVNDQLVRCRIVNPVAGTILTKYAQAHEMAVTGKPLYKVADLREVILRAYVTGDQMQRIKPGQKVTVLIEGSPGEDGQHDGTLEWISDKAEFTPKTIQTKDERANLVYAVKIRVKNNGYLKIGMYAEVKF